MLLAMEFEGIGGGCMETYTGAVLLAISVTLDPSSILEFGFYSVGSIFTNFFKKIYSHRPFKKAVDWCVIREGRNFVQDHRTILFKFLFELFSELFY